MATTAVIPMSDELKKELAEITNVQRAAVLMLLLGEDLASNIISYLDPKEVQELGAAMVSVADMSQEAVNAVLDQFVDLLKRQTSLSLGTTEYVETVLKRALGPDKASSVLSRIMPNRASRGLEILQWMDARAIAEMIKTELEKILTTKGSIKINKKTNALIVKDVLENIVLINQKFNSIDI